MTDRQQEFYQSGSSKTRLYTSRWQWLERWLPSINRRDLAVSLLPRGQRLLDVGCGGGHLLLQAAENYRELYGVDIAPVCVANTKQTLRGLQKQKIDVRQVNIDSTGLPFEEDFFDTVTMIAVLQFLFDVESTLQEVRRVLRSGGTFIFETNNLAFVGHRLTLLLGQQPQTTASFDGWDGNTLHYFVLKPLITLLAHQGFTVQKVCSAGRLSRLRSWWPGLLAQNFMIVVQKGDV